PFPPAFAEAKGRSRFGRWPVVGAQRKKLDRATRQGAYRRDDGGGDLPDRPAIPDAALHRVAAARRGGRRRRAGQHLQPAEVPLARVRGTTTASRAAGSASPFRAPSA